MSCRNRSKAHCRGSFLRRRLRARRQEQEAPRIHAGNQTLGAGVRGRQACGRGKSCDARPNRRHGAPEAGVQTAGNAASGDRDKTAAESFADIRAGPGSSDSRRKESVAARADCRRDESAAEGLADPGHRGLRLSHDRGETPGAADGYGDRGCASHPESDRCANTDAGPRTEPNGGLGAGCRDSDRGNADTDDFAARPGDSVNGSHGSRDGSEGDADSAADAAPDAASDAQEAAPRADGPTAADQAFATRAASADAGPDPRAGPGDDDRSSLRQ
jgi:hypothetical protein